MWGRPNWSRFSVVSQATWLSTEAGRQRAWVCIHVWVWGSQTGELWTTRVVFTVLAM